MVLLDASGSIASYEFSHMVSFVADLLKPFSLGEDEVRFSLLLVGTEPRLDFGFETHRTQEALQAALRQVKQLRGDTNTEKALDMARDRVLPPGVPGGTRPNLPRVLLWLTDGVDPGQVSEPMKELRDEGVAVLVVSTGHGNYQVLRQVVTPPVEDHLYFVDIDDINIILEDVRNAIIGKFLSVQDCSGAEEELKNTEKTFEVLFFFIVYLFCMATVNCHWKVGHCAPASVTLTPGDSETGTQGGARGGRDIDRASELEIRERSRGLFI